MFDWVIFEQVLARWWRLVVFRKFMNFLTRPSKWQAKGGVFCIVDWLIVALFGRWRNTEWVDDRWRHPVASGVALGMLQRAMRFVSHRRTAMWTKMAGKRCALFAIVNFVIDHYRS